MSKERPFFRGADTSFGIFYPTDYLIAVFGSLGNATRAEARLHSAGFSQDDVRVVDSASVVDDIKMRLTDADWIDRLKRMFSVGKEKDFWNDDLRWAEEGAGFMAVYCNTDEITEQVVDLIRSLQPISMRRYHALAIQTLT